MVKLEENKSQIWFKLLEGDGTPIEGSDETWILPSGHLKGEFRAFPCEASRRIDENCEWYLDPSYREVTWLVSDPSKLYKANSGMKVFIAQIYDTPLLEEPGMIWVNRVSLLREATNLDLKPFGIHRSFGQIIS